MHSSARVVARLARKQCTRGVRTSAVAHRAPTLNAIDLNVRAMKQSQTLAINELSQSLEREGKIVSKFGLGQSPFPVPDVMVKSLMKHAPEKDYLAVAGLAALREAIADWCTRVIGGRDHHADDVVIGPGSKELLFLMQVVYGSELMLPQPSWVSYQPQAHLLRRPVTWLKCSLDDGWKLRPDVLDAACKEDPSKPRTLVLNSPSNPTGAVHSEQELKEIAEVCERYGILVISDEIYGKLTFDGQYHSISRFYPEGTVVMSGASKWLGSGGWRVGFASFPPELKAVRDAMLVCASETFTSVAAPLQYAVCEGFLPNPDIDHYLEASTRILKHVSTQVNASLVEGGARVATVNGGFYTMPDFTNCRRAQRYSCANDLIMDALEHANVAMLPGSNFGLPESDLVARMAFVDFDGGAAIDAIDELPKDADTTDPAVQEFLNKYCPKVVNGARALGDLMQQE